MKSLSILILLGTLSAIVLGALFAITPALAQSAAPQENVSIEASVANNQAIAPVTGSTVDTASAAPITVAQDVAEQAPSAELSNADPGTVMASTFTINVEKDTASAEAAQETQTQAQTQASVAETLVDLSTFATSVTNGNSNQVTGLYIENVLAYSVVRQPSGNAAFVSENAGEVTQFALAAQYGSQAFLAHNYLAGASFSTLTAGEVITLVYGDGSIQLFQVETIKRFQALSPDSTQSSFIDLGSGEKLSASNLFHSVYNSDNSVVLQTCIAQDGISTWGRLFITAVPLS